MKIYCWDFDGTIAHSKFLWCKSVYTAYMELGKQQSIDLMEVEKQMRCGFTWHTPDNDYSCMTGEKWWEYMKTLFVNCYENLGICPLDAEKASENVRSVIKRLDNYTLYEDAKSTLEYVLSKGNKNVILSNNYPDLEEVICGLGLGAYFDHLVVSAVVGYDKPRIEIFNMVKKLYGENNEFIMIGDSVKADIEGGKSAGMTTVLVHKGYDEMADYCFNNLSDICGMI